MMQVSGQLHRMECILYIMRFKPYMTGKEAWDT